MLGIILKCNKMRLSQYPLTIDVTSLIRSMLLVISISSRYAHWITRLCCIKTLFLVSLWTERCCLCVKDFSLMCTCYVHAMISSPIEGSPRKFSLIIMLGPYFLGTFEKLRKATSSFVMSVCLSVCLSVSPSVPHGTTQLPLDGFL
jgi:hypothetical protein